MNMDWNSAYFRFIEKNALRKDSAGSQKHHILPRSQGGTGSKRNLVALSRRNHVVAHILFALKEKQLGRGYMNYAPSYDVGQDVDNILKAYPPLLRLRIAIGNEKARKILGKTTMTVTEFAKAEVLHYRLEPKCKNHFILKVILDTIREGRAFGAEVSFV